MHENSTNRVKFAELLRYQASKSSDESISFKEYVDRMKEGQNDTYYITGTSVAAVSSSPFLESLRKKGLARFAFKVFIMMFIMMSPAW